MSAALPVLINTCAGGGCGAEEVDKVRDLFHVAGVEARIMPARDGAELRELTKTVARENAPVVVAGGGDGTINTVASALAGTATALGVLPLGTLNHFAKDLRIPLDLAEAARIIVAGHQIAVDVGEVNGAIFINNSSIGLYADMVRMRSKQQQQLGLGKWHAMFWSTLAVMRRSPFLSVQLRLDDLQHHYRTPFIFIGNNEYEMEGFNIGRRERLDGARLSLYVTQRRGRWGLLGLALRALFGRLHQANDFTAAAAYSITVETRRRRLPVATDGEITTMDMPLEYRIRPGALRVIVAAPGAEKV